MNLVLPAFALGVLFLSGKSLIKQMERVAVTNFRIQVGSFKITEVLLKVTLDIYNPNSTALKFGYFQGFIYRNGIKLGRFDFNDDGKNTKFPGRSTTPATFNVRITTAGIVSNLFNIIKNLKGQKPIDTTFSIDAILNVGGYDLPIKYSYDIKNVISGIGKPYAKFEFSTNEEMAAYLKKPCGDTKFSLNGIAGNGGKDGKLYEGDLKNPNRKREIHPGKKVFGVLVKKPTYGPWIYEKKKKENIHVEMY